MLCLTCAYDKGNDDIDYNDIIVIDSRLQNRWRKIKAAAQYRA